MSSSKPYIIRGEDVTSVPKFQLVQCNESRSEGGNVDDDEGNVSNELIAVDIREIEGEEVEELPNDEVESRLLNPEGDEVSVGGDNAFKAFGVAECPECAEVDCSRPVQECCGHVKCRRCFLSNDDGCKQCQRVSIANDLPDKDSKTSILKEVEIPSNESYPNDVVEEIYIEPSANEYILELQQESGNKSLAIVSSETLKQLGIEHDTGVNCKTKDGKATIAIHGTVALREAEVGENIPVTSQGGQRSPKKRPRKKPTKDGSWKHVLTLQTEPPIYRCTECNEEFNTKYQRKFHFYCDPDNGKRPYECEFCKMEFISSSHYEYHMCMHTGEKPYGCPICSQRFIQKVKLNRHMLCHSNTSTKSKSKSKCSQQFLCAYCKKGFNSLSNCKKHVRTHTDARPHECNMCGKRFSLKAYLDSHVRTHIQERRYKCTECERKFTTAKDLKRHFLCHTGEIPFECSLCHVRFRRKDNLERHIRQTHKLSPKVTKLMGNEAMEQWKASREVASNNSDSSDSSERVHPLQHHMAIESIAELVTGT